MKRCFLIMVTVGLLIGCGVEKEADAQCCNQSQVVTVMEPQTTYVPQTTMVPVKYKATTTYQRVNDCGVRRAFNWPGFLGCTLGCAAQNRDARRARRNARFGCN